jgi:hypothetical protein
VTGKASGCRREGVPDISVVNTINGQVQYTVIGNGDGTIQPQVRYAAKFTPAWVSAGDLNCDGELDLAVGSGGTLPAMRGGEPQPTARVRMSAPDVPTPRSAGSRCYDCTTGRTRQEAVLAPAVDAAFPFGGLVRRGFSRAIPLSQD